ncbi:MAG: hypothetical protein DRI28_01725 [Caldiserica bacterium]|nr:MAG: hypothetical protein DRI28_01725 [Caldisericota bacterium]
MFEFKKVEIKGEINLTDKRENFDKDGVSFLKKGELKYNLKFDKEIFIKEVSLFLNIDEKVKLFRNGFQSWSPSFEIERDTKIKKPLLPFLKISYLDPKDSGIKDSYFLTYIKRDNTYHFLIPENYNLLVKFSLLKEGLKITFEIGKSIREVSLPKIKISSRFLWKGGKQKVYGWTSWYSYYRKISHQEIEKNINSIKTLPINLNYFQIDDGWEMSVGDWFENNKFKGTLKKLADGINKNNVKAGIWMAPFVVEKRSEIFRKHREWILKDRKGRMKFAGFNPFWSGLFFPLDITREDVKDYILGRIRYLRKLGFDLFKFDFLYSLFIPGRHKKDISRMELFYEGMRILKEGVEGGEILGCGAPFILKEGLYDILRVGPDTKDSWRDWFLNLIGYEGETSAMNSLRNTLSRSFILSKFFLKDPDVIFLKPEKLTRIEMETLIISNFFLSDIIFFSDPLYKLNRNHFSLLFSLKQYEDFTLNEFQWDNQLFKFKGTVGNGSISGFVNLGDRKVKIETKDLKEILFKKDRDFLYPHETRVFVER